MTTRRMLKAGLRVPEKVVQQHALNLLRNVGARVWVLGTRRRRGDFPGTMQTPGIADVFAILPPPPLKSDRRSPVPLWFECKAAGGRLRPEQAEFRTACLEAELAHVVGGVDELMSFLVRGGWLKSQNVPHYKQPQPAPIAGAEDRRR